MRRAVVCPDAGLRTEPQPLGLHHLLPGAEGRGREVGAALRVVVDGPDVRERRAVCGEEALQHGLQRGPEVSAERSRKLSAAKAGM